MTDPVSSSLLRQEGPQQEEFTVEYAARKVLETFERDEAAGYRSSTRQYAIAMLRKAFDIQEASGTCKTDLAAAQARIEVLEGSIDYLRNVIDHPVRQETKTTI